MKRARVLELAMTVFFAAVFIYANFVTVRLIMRLGTEVYTYERLSVAYDIGGAAALDKELGKIVSAADAPRAVAIGRDFAAKRATLADPGGYVAKMVARKMRAIHLLRNGRTIAITVLVCGFIFRLITARRKRKAAKA